MTHKIRNELIDNFVNTSIELQNKVTFNIEPAFKYTFKKQHTINTIFEALFESPIKQYAHIPRAFTITISGGQGALQLDIGEHTLDIDLDSSLFDMHDPSDIAICIRELTSLDFEENDNA